MAERSERSTAKNTTTIERTSDRELVVARVVNGPARLVYEAWSDPKLFQQWWVPKSAPITLLSCEVDARVGGGYRLVFAAGGQEMAFFGTYREVVPNAKLVWTNDEAGEDGPLSTVTFEETDGKTRVVMHELYPTKEALDAAIESGSSSGNEETFEQLEEFIAARVANVARA